MNPSARLILSLVFVYFIQSIQGQQSSLTVLDICPRKIVVETDDYDCSSGRTSERLAGKELVLLNSSKIRIREIDSKGTRVYECKCDYGIFPEEREVIDCETGDQLPASDNCSEGVCAPFYFFDLLYFRWIEDNIVSSQDDCDEFKFQYGRTKPGFFKTDFNLATPAFIPTFFEGIGRTDRAVVMVCPWEGTDYFSYDYIKNNYESSMDVIYQNAVSYETCMGVVNPGAFFFDLNPSTYDEAIFSDDFQTLEDVESVDSPVELSDVLIKSVNGTTADGVSDILISINGYQDGTIDIEELDERYGSIRMPWGNQAFDFSGSPFHVIIYSPPESFPDDLPKLTTPEGHVYTRVKIKMEAGAPSGEKVDAEFSIPLIRPPIVLVHGTFDKPENCWKTPIEGEKSMYQSLLDEGYVVRTVDYQDSNGDESDPCSNFAEGLFDNTSISSFDCNKKVVYENPGGIKDAIDYFRDTLFVAAAQADVIGHSMGGVLPRVLASDDDLFATRYNDDYYRNDNFNDGDINRLISIASTHHGSDGSEFLLDFNMSWKDSNLPLLERLANGSLTGLIWFGKGIGNTGAVRDQMPGSKALQRIGPTKVPSHAIVCTIEDFEAIADNEADADPLFNYANLLRGLTSYFYFFPGSVKNYFINVVDKYRRLPSSLQNSNKFKYDDVPIAALPRNEVLMGAKPRGLEMFTEKIEDGLAEFWQNWHLFQENVDDTWISDEETTYKLQYETAEYNHYEEDDDFNNFIEERRYDIISGEEKDDSEIADSKNFALDYIRYLMFKNDLNDCVVRYESQTGGMEEPYITHFDDHIHSFAPRYKDVNDRVKSLLSGGMEDFNMDGFPAAGKKLPVSIPNPDFIMTGANRRSDDRPSPLRYGEEAICWSGMVPAHATAFLDVAMRKDVVILTRPVNPDATPLIATNSATKGMNLKGKSSNWGPHKGYIPVLQKYSKLWFLYGDDHEERDTQIVQFSAKTKKQLKKEPEMVVEASLKVTYDCPENDDDFEIYVDTFGVDAAESIYLVQEIEDGFKVQQWSKQIDGLCPNNLIEQSDLGNLIPLKVMSKPRTDDTIYYTADYDLLAIGFKDPTLINLEEDKYIVKTLEDFNKEKGFITPEQSELLDTLNEEVRLTGYEGGNVSHHGPENQFYILSNPSEGSPYVDYPITAFYKDSRGRGVILGISRGPKGFRDYYLKRFMARMRRKGYDLYENIHSPGWDWSYHSTYTYEKGWDDRDSPRIKDSPEEIPFEENCRETNVIPEHEYYYVEEKDQSILENTYVKIYPNPATEIINVDIGVSEIYPINYRLTNNMGMMVRQGKRLLDGPLESFTIDVAGIPPGIYVVTIQLKNGIYSRSVSIIN
ncbi:MAG: T9SS type A sorting domain-containing protein [Saprospiraceae bacterium]|nr:T9SS type A sorting domain-containing protein [Saprospiraceae bacterium]